MTTPTDRHDPDLRDRFADVASSLDIPAGDLAEVRSRQRSRARHQRITTAVAGVAVVLGISLTVAELTPGPRGPAIDDPLGGPSVIQPTADPSTEPSTPMTEAEPQANEEPRSEVGIVEFGPTYPWPHTWFGPEGLRRDDQDLPTPIGDGGVARAVAFDGGVVFQPAMGRTPDGPPLGGAIMVWDGDEAVRELAPAARVQRLLTVADGRAWFTFRTGGVGEEDEERLASVALGGGEVEVLGTSNGVESFTDEVVFLDADRSGPVAYFTCHMQCSLYRAPAVDELVRPVSGGGTFLAAGWLFGLAAAPTADALAFVEGPDPNLPDSAVALVVIDLDGTELARVPLPEGIDYASGRVEFTPDGRDVVVSDTEGGFLVSDVLGDPHVDRLGPRSGLTFHGTERATTE